MSEETVTPRQPAKRKRSWLVRSLVYGLLYVLVSGCLGVRLAFELPFHLTCGWAIHAYQMLPLLVAEWRSALLPLVALVVAGLMLHRFIRWAIQAETRKRPWRPSHTLAAMALLLLGYGAAITLIGIAHQSSWLIGERWLDDGTSSASSAGRAMTKTMTLLRALEEFRAVKGCYPESLRELEVAPELLLTETGSGAGLEPIIYLRPGGKQPEDEDQPVLVSPMVGRRKVVVGFMSTTAHMMNLEALEKMLDPAAPPPAPAPPSADE